MDFVLNAPSFVVALNSLRDLAREVLFSAQIAPTHSVVHRSAGRNPTRSPSTRSSRDPDDLRFPTLRSAR